MYEAICERIHQELDTLDQKYGNGSPMSDKELEDIRAMASVLVKLSTYEAMHENAKRDRYPSRYDRRW